MPERAFPGLELGYTNWQGRSKCKIQYVVSLQLMYVTLGDLYLLIGRPGGQHFWQLVAEGEGVVVPMPGSAGTSQEETPETEEVQGCQQQAAEVEHEDVANACCCWGGRVIFSCVSLAVEDVG